MKFTDTCCLGRNFAPLYYTGQTCNVHGFTPQREPVENISRIGGGATLWFDKNGGQGYIIVMHQALMFVDQLDHTLLNPDQIRHEGHSLCDDPWDPHRPRYCDACSRGFGDSRNGK